MTIKHRRKPYMPDSDIGKKEWMERFITTIESHPQRYGFNDDRMFEYYQRTIRNFIKAADEVTNPALRTPGAVKAKNDARKEAVALCRSMAMLLKWDSMLSEKEKQAFGLNIDHAPAEEAKVPEGYLSGTRGYPDLAVQSSPNGGHMIRYRVLGCTSKSKPKGVSHLLLFAAIGEKPKMRRTHARLLGAYTKRPFEIMFPMECGLEGLYVTYYGRWLTTRGEMSPWSPGISKIIGETQLSLHECEFSHLFEKTGFIDALPELPQSAERGRVQIDHHRPLLEGAAMDMSEASRELPAHELAELTISLLNAA